jgi:hypothetical protein
MGANHVHFTRIDEKKFCCIIVLGFKIYKPAIKDIDKTDVLNRIYSVKDG